MAYERGKQQVYDKIIMDNGLTLMGENIPHFRSVSVGLWVRNGSVNEQDANNGYSHFIEHMLFKGTQKRTARQIAEEMDRIGGQMNAFTSKECTCYYVKVMDEHLPLSMDLISDLALNATFDEGEMEKEKSVIGEEISMVEDQPEDLVHELLAKAHFGGHPLSRTILGPVENIQKAAPADLKAFMKERYKPGTSVVSVAGRYDANKVRDLTQQFFGAWDAGSASIEGIPGDPMRRTVEVKEKPIEQTHLCVAFPGVKQGEDDAYTLSVLNNALGGGMSSRLFQRIREEHGMAYSVYSYPSSYSTCGTFAVYAGTAPKNAQQVIGMIGEEIRRFLKEGIAAQEFADAKEQLKGGYTLGQESTSARMTAIGRSQLMLGRTQTEDDVLQKIQKVTRDDVMRIAEQLLTAPYSASCVGPDVKLDFSPIGG
jgi:predicted Zn-dependent peptidase